MTTPTSSSTEELQRMQDLIQDTSGGTDSDEDGDVDEETVNATVETAICCGDSGCGNSFPADEVGSDFRFAKLCATCYKKGTRDLQKDVSDLFA